LISIKESEKTPAKSLSNFPLSKYYNLICLNSVPLEAFDKSLIVWLLQETLKLS